MQAQIDAIKAKVQDCIRTAEAKFGIKMPYVQIRFDLRGRAAGVAGMRMGMFYLRFNRNHIALGGKTWEHLLNETVPHEVAHTVCQAFPQYGRNHDAGWKRVCIALGGNGTRCYGENDAPEAVAQQRPWVYITTTGHEVRVTSAIHKKIQNQHAGYIMKGGKGRINNQCQYNYMTAATARPVQQPKPAAEHTGSKADQVRHWMRLGLTDAEIIEQATAMFGMKAALVKTYIKNNRNKI